MHSKLLQRPVAATSQKEDISASRELAEEVAARAKRYLGGSPVVIQALGPGTFEVRVQGWKLRGLHQDGRLNLKVDGPNGTVGEHVGTLKEVTRAMATTFKRNTGKNAADTTPTVHNFGCIMIRPDEDTARKVLLIGNAIVKDDEVYTDPEDPSYGRETTPHSTCLWGLKAQGLGEQVAKIVASHAPKGITIGNVTFFPAGDNPYDVVKFDIGMEGMKEFHDALLAEFPDTEETFDYHPHMTISYVKAGLGAKVCRRASQWAGRSVPVSCIAYSSQDGSETLFDLDGHII